MIVFILLFSFSLLLNAQEPTVKSLQAYVNNDITGLPVIRLGTNDKLNIEFDAEAEEEPSFAIVFKFCDENWTQYTDIGLIGINDNTLYNVDVERLPMTIEGAEYHIKESFPQDNVEFLRSGNWKFFITDVQDTSIVYDWGEFYVVKNSTKLKTNIQDWRREGSISGNSELDRVLNLKVSFNIPDSLSPFRVKYVKIIKNLETSNPVILPKESFSTTKGYEWNGANSFTFITRDLEPGNEYRQTNLYDHHRFQYPVTRAQFDGIEYSRFYQFGKRDLNGGFKLMNRNNQYADYLTVQFLFRPPDKTDDDIFIVGSFTNWEVLPWFKLDNKEGLYSINLELKRGIYDYQYVTGIEEGDFVKDIDRRIFEGNFWETNNVYSIFVYYKSPEFGEYDEIIGYKRIVR